VANRVQFLSQNQQTSSFNTAKFRPAIIEGKSHSSGPFWAKIETFRRKTCGFFPQIRQVIDRRNTPPTPYNFLEDRTISTEHGAWWLTACATLPMNNRLRPVTPFDPMITKSAF
jgi:hypothetical protein